MQACFFNTAAEPLFGVYVPPLAATPRNEAVLLCAPIGHEYNRAHWALRQFADQLAWAGVHVFRFDYSGQGDSWGNFDAASWQRWIADVRTALAELCDNSGTSHVSIVGLRLGAVLAHAVARETAVTQLVLWDPVVQGATYLNELRCLQRHRKRLGLPVAPVVPRSSAEELVGYRYSAALIREIAAIDLLQAPAPRAQRIRIVASADRPEYRELHARISACEFALHPDAGDWGTVELHAESLLLGPLQRELLQSFKR
jgi:alpha-beta hydrolase superfamily lysophospholipase